MSPSDYVPTRAQAEAILAFGPQLNAARGSGLYRRAVLAREFREALHEQGFVLAEDFLPWAEAARWYAEDLTRMAHADLRAILMVLTAEALMDFEIEGRFERFAFSPLLDALLHRLAALYGIDGEGLASAA